MNKTTHVKFDNLYQQHCKHLKLKGLRPKTIEAYSRDQSQLFFLLATIKIPGPFAASAHILMIVLTILPMMNCSTIFINSKKRPPGVRSSWTCTA